MAFNRKLLLALQIFLAVATATASVAILTSAFREVRAVRSEFRANITYYAAQVDYELLQLVDHINRYIQNDTQVTSDHLVTRLDIVWSRMAGNSRSTREDFYLSLPGATDVVEETLAFLNEIETDVLTLERGDTQTALAINSTLRQIIERSHAVAMQAIAFDAINDSTQLDNMVRRNTYVIALIALFLGFVVLSLVLSWREVQSSQLVNAELEKRVMDRTRALASANAELTTQIEERGQAEQRFRSIFDHATEAIVIFDVDQGSFVEANARAEALYGLPRSALIGSYGPHNLSPEFQPDGRRSDEAAMGYITEALEGDFPSFEWIHRSIDGVDVPCAISLARFPDPTRRLVRGSIIDLTEKKKAEAVQSDLEARLVQAQKLESIGQLTGGVAHDFNNLLSVIVGNLELLDDEPEEGERKEMTHAALQAAMRGAALTRSMLNFARRADLKPEAISLSDLMGGMGQWMSRTIPATIKVETSIRPDLWQIMADASGVESALLNLVINARDAMPEGGLLVIETENVLVDDGATHPPDRNLKPGKYVMLAVSDTGQGMSADVATKVFEPFFTTKELGTNSGLGLSMVHGFMTQSGGDVRIYSEPGVGTTVKLFFPAHGAAQKVVADAEPTRTHQTPAARILVAEDQEDVLATLARSLKASGHEVIAANSGDAAAALFVQAGSIDLLVTDIVMPGTLQGPALAKHLREIEPDLPVVFLSGYASEATLHGNGLRPDDIRLMKPVARKKLIEAVNTALSARDGALRA